MILKILKIETMIRNYTNCYIIADEDKKEAMVIDPAGDIDKVIETLNLLDVAPKYIYLTHCHADHIGGVEELKNRTGAKVLIHRQENENLKSPFITLSGICGIENLKVIADARVDEGDKLHIGDIEFTVIHTPGHTSRRKFIVCRKIQSFIYRRHFI